MMKPNKARTMARAIKGWLYTKYNDPITTASSAMLSPILLNGSAGETIFVESRVPAFAVCDVNARVPQMTAATILMVGL